MPRILIIDDEECIRETLAVFAEMLGYEPAVAVNPAECDVSNSTSGECAKETACADLLLIDQNMPNSMMGLDVIQRQIERGCKLDIQYKAVMSGALTEDEIKQAKKLGCHVLHKPVSFEILEKWINSVEGKAVS
jgi:CheY-like chemotaxis protein